MTEEVTQQNVVDKLVKKYFNTAFSDANRLAISQSSNDALDTKSISSSFKELIDYDIDNLRGDQIELSAKISQDIKLEFENTTVLVKDLNMIIAINALLSNQDDELYSFIISDTGFISYVSQGHVMMTSTVNNNEQLPFETDTFVDYLIDNYTLFSETPALETVIETN